MLLRRTLMALALALGLAHAQSPAAPQTNAQVKLPVYDVVTIKPNKSGSQSTSVHVDNGNYIATNISLKKMMQDAFSIREDLMDGIPGGIDSARFDVQAKVVNPDPDAFKKLTNRQHAAMMQPILIDRFHLKTHVEFKSLAVYELIALPGGPKFKPAADTTHSSGSSIHNRDMTAHNLSMAALANVLEGQVNRNVIDKTGLTGGYDLALKWSPEDATDAQADAAPGIFTAVQEQLGLKLQPAKGPVETLVVDHVEMPSEN